MWRVGGGGSVVGVCWALVGVSGWTCFWGWHAAVTIRITTAISIDWSGDCCFARVLVTAFFTLRASHVSLRLDLKKNPRNQFFIL